MGWHDAVREQYLGVGVGEDKRAYALVNYGELHMGRETKKKHGTDP